MSLMSTYCPLTIACSHNYLSQPHLSFQYLIHFNELLLHVYAFDLYLLQLKHSRRRPASTHRRGLSMYTNLDHRCGQKRHWSIINKQRETITL